MELGDFQVGQIIRIKDDEVVTNTLPESYQTVLKSQFEIVRIYNTNEYAIETKETVSGKSHQFKTSEVELVNIELFNIQKESKKF